jgi:hypothetical protein
MLSTQRRSSSRGMAALLGSLSAAENDEVRNALDAELSGNVPLTFGIHFKDVRRPAISLATAATSGAAILQGPHHSAQKSTSTGTFAA